MAEFEGKLNLNANASELEVNGKFKLTEEELDKVAGGKPPANIPFIVVATSPVLLELYNQTNGQGPSSQADGEPAVDNFEYGLEAYGPAALSQ